MGTKYDGSNLLRSAAKAIERAADATFEYEETKPFEVMTDPRLAAIDAELDCARNLLEDAEARIFGEKQ